MTKIGAERPILLGEIGAAHGIRGALRVHAFTADPLALGAYGPLFDEEGRRYAIKSLRLLKGAVLVVSFAGISTRNEAEKYSGTKLFIARAALPALEEDEFYHEDLLGLAAVTRDGVLLGHVLALHDFGADDLLEVKPLEGASFHLPFTRAVVPEIDLAGGRLIVAPPLGLLEEKAPAPSAKEADTP